MLKSSSEEYTRIVDCVMKMAVRNTNVSITLKRDNQVEADVQTIGRETTTTLINMKLLYGPQMVKDMFEAKIDVDDTPYRFRCEAHFTGTQYSVSKVNSLIIGKNNCVTSLSSSQHRETIRVR